MIMPMKSFAKNYDAQLIENQPVVRRMRVWQLPAAPHATPRAAAFVPAAFAPARVTPRGGVPREVCLPLSERPLALFGQIEVRK